VYHPIAGIVLSIVGAGSVAFVFACGHYWLPISVLCHIESEQVQGVRYEAESMTALGALHIVEVQRVTTSVAGKEFHGLGLQGFVVLPW
jgi:hypothetical protein